MPAIFISHSSADQQIADDIKSSLAKLGFEHIFLDFDKATGIGAGEHWEKRLYQELSRCHAVVLALTPEWLSSKWCFAELTQARALGKVILPIICKPLGGNVILPEIQAVEVLDWNATGLGRMEQRLRAITNELARGFALDPSRPPYPGIHSFEAEDAAIYFGRDDEARSVIERLDARRSQGGARLLLMIGASGAGKSSLLKAGVLPQLARRKHQWVVLPLMRPEKAPVEALAKAIAQQTGKPGDWRTWHQALCSEHALARIDDLFKDFRVGEARNAVVLLPIDQFEEVFTVTTPQERTVFLKVLTAALDPARDLPLMVIATGRSDVLSGLIEGGDIARVTETFLLEPMPLVRVPRLVEGPATVAGIHIEKGLSDAIARDVESPEALPLLAHALWLLHQRATDDRKLTLAEYHALGDPERGLNPIQNSVRLVADQAIAGGRPTPQELDALRDAFVPHLVRLRLDDGKRVRQPARLSELPPESIRLVRALVEARLLSTRAPADGLQAADAATAVVEVTHEALFKAWPTLDQWLTDEQAFLTDIERIKNAHDDWAQTPAEHRGKALLGGLLLSRTREWLIKHPQRFLSREMQALRDYIAASAATEDAERARNAAREVRTRRMQQWLVRGAIAAAAVFAILAGYAIVAERNAARNLALSIDQTDALIANISSELRDRLGISQDAIKRILNVIDSRFDHLAKAGANSPRLKLSRAAMLAASVDNFISLGDLTEAGKRAQACVDIVRPMLEAAPNDLRVVAEMGRCLEKVGDAAFWRSAFNAAAESYRVSIGLRRRVLAAAPDDAGFKLELCHVLSYFGFALISSGRAPDATESVKEALTMSSEMVASDPDDPRWQREHVESINFASMLLTNLKQHADALPGFRTAADLARRLAAEDPLNATLKRFLSNLLNNVARTLIALKQYDEAVTALTEGLQIKAYLSLVDPENTLWRQELASTLLMLGDALAATGKQDEALTRYTETEALARTLVVLDPKNVLWQIKFTEALMRLVTTKARKGDVTGARAAAEEALKTLALLDGLNVSQSELSERAKATLRGWQQHLEKYLSQTAPQQPDAEPLKGR